jgi:UPF0271 protein
MRSGELTIDLNCDMGELPELFADGTEELLMQQISSANIACGAHAGSRESMEALVNLAAKYGVAVGAHIGYPDRANFGRRTMALSGDEIEESAHSQICILQEIAAKSGLELRHVKPHGALYHDAQESQLIAEAIAKAGLRSGKGLILVEQALTPVVAFWSEMGCRVLAEAFADRTYESDGKLRSRHLPEALITDSSLATKQALRIVQEGAVVAHDGSRVPLEADTICLHGDTPGAFENAKSIRAALRSAGVKVAIPEVRS